MIIEEVRENPNNTALKLKQPLPYRKHHITSLLFVSRCLPIKLDTASSHFLAKVFAFSVETSGRKRGRSVGEKSETSREMGRAPCCDKASVKRGPWSPEEDAKLKAHIEEHGTGGNWIALPQNIGIES